MEGKEEMGEGGRDGERKNYSFHNGALCNNKKKLTTDKRHKWNESQYIIPVKDDLKIHPYNPILSSGKVKGIVMRDK